MPLSSVETLDSANIVDTMNRPIMLLASDLNYYYCKYNKFSGKAYRLYKEFLIASFLPIWEFETTPIDIIYIKDEHIDHTLGISRSYFKLPCFGSQKINNASELDNHNIGLLTKSKISKKFKEDFLKLCFFDIWTANEDRSHNNYNLLIAASNKKYELYPIDHEACFNHTELSQAIIPISYEESLIYSEAFSKIFNTKELNPDKVDSLKDMCYLCIQNCKKEIKDILSKLPVEWGIDIDIEEHFLNNFLFEDNWMKQCWMTFQTYLQYFINQ